MPEVLKGLCWGDSEIWVAYVMHQLVFILAEILCGYSGCEQKLNRDTVEGVPGPPDLVTTILYLGTPYTDSAMKLASGTK